MNASVDDFKFFNVSRNSSDITTDMNGGGGGSTTNEYINVTVFYSNWNYNFPSYINYFEFIPATPTSKNVTPYGQTRSTPIFNLTNYNYGGKNANMFMLINETHSCVDLYASSNSTKPSSNLWNGLVGYWPFDIDARDIAGNNNGVVIGAIFNSTGYLGGDYDFNGSSSNMINLGNSTTLKPINNISISVWFKINNNSGNNLWSLVIADNPDQAPRYGYWLAIDNRTTQGSLWWQISNGTASNSQNTLYSPGFTKGVWYYIVSEYTTSGHISYINGVNISNLGAYNWGSIVYNTTNVTIGRKQAGTYPMNGSIDEVRIYNRSLSSSEISELYTRSYNKYYDTKLKNNWTIVNWNAEYLNNSKLWLWADYNCNYTTWNLWQPDLYFRTCCKDCICSEDLV
jgi:hypothetical protein